MWMTPDDAAVMYRDAKDKVKQVEILADLMCCEIEDVVEMLTLKGMDIPSPYGNHRKLWTVEDDNFLLSMLNQGRGYDEIANKIGRTKQACWSRIHYLRENKRGK